MDTPKSITVPFQGDYQWLDQIQVVGIHVSVFWNIRGISNGVVVVGSVDL